MSESAESDIQGAYVGAPCKLICVRKAAIAAQLVVARPMGGTTLSAEGQYRGSAMESQEQSPGDVVTAGEDSHPITQAIDAVEVTHAGATAPAANTMDPPTIPLAPMKRMQARFNPLADGLMYVVVFVGGFVGVGCRHALDMLLPSVSGTPFVVGTFVSNMVACFLFAMLTEFMATASWLRRRVRQVVSRGVGLGLLGGLSTMSGVMLETMEGLHERHIASALGYLAGNFAGGLLTAAAGVVLMQALLSRSTRKRVRGAFSAVSVSDSAESDTLGVRDGMSDDAQPTVVTPFITPSAEASQTTPVRKSETANSLFAPLAPDEMAAYVAIDGKLAARIVLRDVPRANAKRSLARLHELGIKELSMLTGDKAASARIIANEVGIDDVQSELFPEDKVAAVKNATESTHQNQSMPARIMRRITGESRNRQVTMMVGDGVNDAPVLAVADIGMAMTDGTSTAASESAQVVIMNDDIASVPRAIAIARRTKNVMLQAVLIGLSLAIIGMVAAAFNLIPVVVGAFMQEVIDVVSILWALTVLFDRGESA